MNPQPAQWRCQAPLIVGQAEARLVCVDEASKQLIVKVREPLPAKPGETEKFDFEYVRNRTANLFMIAEPLVGVRNILVSDRRTAAEFAKVLYSAKVNLKHDEPEASATVASPEAVANASGSSCQTVKTTVVEYISFLAVPQEANG